MARLPPATSLKVSRLEFMGGPLAVAIRRVLPYGVTIARAPAALSTAGLRDRRRAFDKRAACQRIKPALSLFGNGRKERDESGQVHGGYLQHSVDGNPQLDEGGERVETVILRRWPPKSPPTRCQCSE